MDESATQPISQSPTIQPLPLPPHLRPQPGHVSHIPKVIHVPVGQQAHLNPSSSSSPNIPHQPPRPPITPLHNIPAHVQIKPGQIQQIHVANKQANIAGGPQQIFVSPSPGQHKPPQIIQVQPRPTTSSQPRIISVGRPPPRHMVSPAQLQGPHQQSPRIIHALPHGSPQFQPPRPLPQGQPQIQQYRQLTPLQPGMTAMNESKKVTPILVGSPSPIVKKILVQNPNPNPNQSQQGPANIVLDDGPNGTRILTPYVPQPVGMYVPHSQMQGHQIGGQSHIPMQVMDQSRQQKLEDAALVKLNKREEKERLKAEKERLKKEKKEAAEKAKKEKQERDRQEKEKTMCPHGKHSSKCPTCRGPKKAMCPHGRQKSQCKDCGGSAICPHGRRKVICRDCGGTSICPHNRQKATCKECGGSAICIHSRQKFQCRDCGGSAICKHGKPKPYCKECGGSAICKHDKNKYTCPECKKENTGYAPRQKKPAANLKPKKLPASKATSAADAMANNGTFVGIDGSLLMNGGTYAGSSMQAQMPSSAMGGMENLLNSAELIESVGQNASSSIIVQQVGGVGFNNASNSLNEFKQTTTGGNQMAVDTGAGLNSSLKKRTIDEVNQGNEETGSS